MMREDARNLTEETWEEAEVAPGAPRANDHIEAAHIEAALRQARQDPLQHRIL